MPSRSEGTRHRKDLPAQRNQPTAGRKGEWLLSRSQTCRSQSGRSGDFVGRSNRISNGPAIREAFSQRAYTVFRPCARGWVTSPPGPSISGFYEEMLTGSRGPARCSGRKDSFRHRRRRARERGEGRSPLSPSRSSPGAGHAGPPSPAPSRRTRRVTAFPGTVGAPCRARESPPALGGKARISASNAMYYDGGT